MTIVLVDNWNPQSPLFSYNIDFFKKSFKKWWGLGPTSPTIWPPLHVALHAMICMHVKFGSIWCIISELLFVISCSFTLKVFSRLCLFQNTVIWLLCIQYVFMYLYTLYICYILLASSDSIICEKVTEVSLFSIFSIISADIIGNMWINQHMLRYFCMHM